jgi:hypothetical protein
MPSKKKLHARVSGRKRQRDKQAGSLVEFFRAAPTGGQAIDLTRKRDTTRTLKW